MTWILGSGVIWGYGALISDVRATWPDDRCLDSLQKIYPVGTWMMAGFAGSVKFGFDMITDMRRAFGPPQQGYAWMPQIAAWRWRRRARRAFAEAPAEIQALQSSILLVGVSPCRNGPWHWTRCIRMRSPTFLPEFARPFSWLSVGTGATHELAQQYAAQDMTALGETFGRAEIANPGDTASSMASGIARQLTRNPIAQVSNKLQVGTVWQNRHVIQTLEGEEHGPAWSMWRLVEPEGLATSWDEFQQISETAGMHAAAATT